MSLGLRLFSISWARALAQCAGVSVAVVIMFVEFGFFRGVVDSQANIARLANGDLVVVHENRTHLNKWTDFKRIRLAQLAASDAVTAVVPLYKGTMALRTATTGKRKRIVVFAFPPGSLPFRGVGLDRVGHLLKLPNTVLFDRRSRSVYGELALGDLLDLDDRRFRLGGFVRIGPSIVNDGALLMSEGAWLRMIPWDEPVMAVIRLEPGAHPPTVAAALERSVPDLTILTPAELYDREVAYTLQVAPIGVIFAVGLVAGLVVGTVVCYQILFNEITHRTSQYATLKAMGFTNWFLRRCVVEYALALGAAGFALGAAVSSVLYRVIAERAALVLHFSAGTAALVGFLTVGMCVVAALFASRRACRIDPAELL